MKNTQTEKTAIRQLPDQKTPDVVWSDAHCNDFGVSRPQAAHSPLPWSITDVDKILRIGAPGSGDVAHIFRTVLNGDAKANARLIVASVNHAQALAEALRHLMAITRNDEALQYREAREALARWEGAQ